jgi:S-DNA-T family DNA segregation ATPase FtsK/SpoIIIE
LEKVALPVVGLVIPLVLSLVMAVVLQSSLALMMGVLGPVMVFASWVQQKKTHQRSAHRLTQEFIAAQQDFQRELETARDTERALARTALPNVLGWMTDPLWRRESSPSMLVRVGEGLWSPPAQHPLQGTGVIHAMPAGVDATKGLALIATSEAIGVWRNLVVQWLVASGPGGLDPMPELSGDPIGTEFRGVSRLVWVSGIAEVPRDCQIVVVHQGDSLISITEKGQPPRQVRPDSLSFAEFLWAVEKLGAGETPVPMPDTAEDSAGSRGHLFAQLSLESPIVDVVAEGPHTVVWGATGSGKSVTVCALVQSLAARYTPRQLVCVLVDFKGGAGLRPLADLPHTIGMVNDLDPVRSDRALSGLVAEMEKRERIMAQHQVSDVAQLDHSIECPRLLVVVDEVAWLCQTSPLWADTLSDVAQRGRSLGVHLILSTQRITGVLPRALMANVSLRVCGRISEESEVLEWMPDATSTLTAALRHTAPGRALVAGALSTPAWHGVSAYAPDPLAASAGGPVLDSQWRVWSEELPQLSAPQVGAWALWDVPESQTHELLQENPVDQGSVVIVGDSGSGKTSTGFALAALAARSFVAPAHPAELWQCLRDLNASAAVVLVDDADALLHRAGAEAEAFMMDALEGFDGALLITVGPRHRLARGLARLAPGRVVLSLAHAEDRSVWGGCAGNTPGRGSFSGKDIQVLFPHPAPTLWSPAQPSGSSKPPIVITEAPDRWTATATAFVGNPDEILAQWQRISAAIADTDVIVDEIGHRDIRHATLGRITLPPLAPPPGWCWVWRGGVAYLATSAGRGRS